MELEYLNSKNIYYAFISGAKTVINNKNNLNKINVFPVADGDTGSNLASTMNNIVYESEILDSAKFTLRSIADAALFGARGNSGIIFAQFINGLTIEVEDNLEISITSFSESVKKAVPYAYGAVSNPTEGTMLTVIKDWAEAIYSARKTTKHFAELLKIALNAAMLSLNDTPNKLTVLKKYSVVDSGANGFVNFLEGFYYFIQQGEIPELSMFPTKNDLYSNSDIHLTNETIEYRFCTEAFIQGDHLSQNIIKDLISDLGNSLIIAGYDKKFRIHLHTNNPQELFYRISTLGNILQQKAEDMVKQQAILNNRLYKIALVTDSIADLPEDFIDRNQITVIPINLLIDGSAYFDKLTITSENFYKLVKKAKEYPSSSQPSIKSVENIFSFLSSHFDSIIAITVSKELSGTYNAVSKASKVFIDAGKKISVIDSKLNSGAEGLLVMKAAEAISLGKTHDEVVNIVITSIPKTKIFVSVNTLKYMVRAGRVKPMAGLLANILNLKPIVTLNEYGKSASLGKAFSKKSTRKMVAKLVTEYLREGNIEKYSIVHAGVEEDAIKFSKVFEELIGKKPEYIMDISTIVAMNAGLGCIAISFMME